MNQIWGTSFLDKATKEEHEQLRGLTSSFLSKLSFFIINLPRIYFLVYNKELPCIQQDKPQQVWKKRLRRVFFFFLIQEALSTRTFCAQFHPRFTRKTPDARRTMVYYVETIATQRYLIIIHPWTRIHVVKRIELIKRVETTKISNPTVPVGVKEVFITVKPQMW